MEYILVYCLQRGKVFLSIQKSHSRLSKRHWLTPKGNPTAELLPLNFSVASLIELEKIYMLYVPSG